MKLTRKEYYPLYDAHEKPASTIFHKYISKKIARFITFYFLRLNITPNQMSVLSFVLLTIGIIFLLSMDRLIGGIIFIVLSQLSYGIDCSDGVVARITKKSSNFGAFLDLFMDRISLFAMQFGVGLSIYPSLSNSELFVFVLSCFMYYLYTIVAMMKGFCFPKQKGVMKKGLLANDLKSVFVKFLYEFIDTGIMLFIVGVSYLLHVEFYTMVSYGVLGLILILGTFYFLLNNEE